MDGLLRWKFIRCLRRLEIILSLHIHVLILIVLLFRFGIGVLLNVSQSHERIADGPLMGIVPRKPWIVTDSQLAKVRRLEIMFHRI